MTSDQYKNDMKRDKYIISDMKCDNNNMRCDNYSKRLYNVINDKKCDIM